MVDFAGIGSKGPNCPICMASSFWLTDPIETVKSAYQCGTCLRIYNYYIGLVVWWPNDQGIAPPYGGAADKVYIIEEEEYPPGTRIRYV